MLNRYNFSGLLPNQIILALPEFCDKRHHLNIACRKCRYGLRCDSKHIAIIFHRSNIVAVGYNYYRQYSHSKEIYSVHAEYDAIMRLKDKVARGKLKPKKYSLLVIRVKNSGELKLSKPCADCQKRLDNCNLINKVIWSL
jgi:deoxycytidylate deaminase